MYETFPEHMRPAIARLGDDPEFEDIHAALATPEGPAGLTRRRFLQSAAAMGGATALSVGTMAKVAAAMAPLGEGDPILVVIYLGGGNDGLNTIVPAGDAAYGRLRRSTSVAAGSIPLGDGGMSMHPALRKLAERYRQRKVAVVQGVGDPGLDHSHFSATATWMAGTSGTDRRTGWLGRFLDTMPDAGTGLRGVTLDAMIPLHLLGARSEVSCLGSLGPFGANRSDGADVAMFDSLRLMGTDSTLGALGKAVGAANQRGVDRARDFATAYSSPAGPTDPTLTTQLYRAARVINANVGARVLGATLATFDTHRDQAWMHNHLLTDLDAAIDRFYATLHPRWADQVVIMTFSEFGRRAADNGSGTDHGTSSPLLVIGDRVRGGLHGPRPSLTDLDARGDLRVTVDFRSVYSTVLGRWFGVDPKPILGADYAQLDLFSSRPTRTVTATGAPDARFAPFRNAPDFVDHQYEEFLERLPTLANRAAWIRRMQSGTTSIPAALEEFFLASPYGRRGLVISRTMFATTGAAASFDDLHRWMAMDAVSGLRPVVNEIVNLPAWRARYNRMWSTDLLIRLHRDMTGASPSLPFIAAWKPRIDSDAAAGSIDMIVALSATAAAGRRFSYEALAANTHSVMLRRAPVASQTKVWADKMKAGMTVRSVLWYFYRVGEYRRRFA